ncbi:MAG: repressor LexA [Gammaproteobacteria bacterium]|nr:repressor LexA [Gammaproteobacteria bacterium]MBQ0841005.1 repressor LexA [Gammaproteobacteria bacterium]
MAKGLTARQKQIIDLIQRHIDDTGFPPTRAEIAKELGFRSANAAEEHLRALHRKGAIEMIPGASRGIRIVEDNNAPKGIPIVGQVAAGNPILAAENIDDYCEVPAQLFHPSADFFLRVRGESMQDIGILDGDLLAVHSTPVAENGQVVVARIGDEVTVKRLKKTRSRYIISLLPENALFEPITVDLREQEFAIEGVYAGVIRTH